MKLYHLTCLILPNLSDQEAKKIQEEIISLIIEKQGILVQTKNFLKKELGSPIKNISKAYLLELSFRLVSSKLEELKKNLKQENKILRFLILRKEIQKKSLRIKRRALSFTFGKVKEKPLLRAKTLISSKANKQKKVELKEIDKKLEEVLKE